MTTYIAIDNYYPDKVGLRFDNLRKLKKYMIENYHSNFTIYKKVSE